VPVLFVGSFLLFLAVRSAFDPLSKLRQLRDPEVIQRETERLGLDRSVPVQYMKWLKGFVTGDWGVSVRTSGDVRPMITDALVVTLQLLVPALILATVAAIAVGVYSALRQYSSRRSPSGRNGPSTSRSRRCTSSAFTHQGNRTRCSTPHATWCFRC
jgi:peptide/nickel transport system permease protein